MAQSEAYVKDVIQIQDETLFGNNRYNKVGLVEQVQNINQQITILQNAPESQDQEQLDEMLLSKADKTELIDSYSKTEDDALLLLKADKTLLIDSDSKSEDDALLLLKDNIVDIVDSYSKIEDDALLLLKTDKSELIDSYSKIEYDALLVLKADKTDTYSKTEDDALLLLKADKSDTYSKSENDALLLLKADKSELIDSYSKSEDDALLVLKANVADLANYADLISAQTISGQKQFGIINVSSISKQSKNEASILLAGGGEVLVSSLVNQPQLQEVRDIATGKSKSYVFSAQGQLNDWMAIQDNIAKLVIGDNLYIVDKEVTDYWWDETDLKVLESELPDMSSVMTTLGTATGGGYDNNSVFLAGGGVRSIADIQSASYSKSETYARDEVYTKSEGEVLLLLKADKTQLIDSYTKTETNNLLNSKTDTGVSYTKSEDDTLLFAKADKTQLIDAYTKGETDNLLNNQANNGVSYTKDEDDTLLFAKTDKTQLIDSQIQGETDNLLNNKANQSTTYTKIETDQLISQIEVGDVDLSGYMTLDTSQTINANKTFNNSCRFRAGLSVSATVRQAEGISCIGSVQKSYKFITGNNSVLFGPIDQLILSRYYLVSINPFYLKYSYGVQAYASIQSLDTSDTVYYENTDGGIGIGGRISCYIITLSI
ncbi:MAG: hypothetical protein EZS28_025319 [Streblomastix strix]|uniref:Uncharacterized protein n=1 Tax=Streblomastix strix TaxID=222440 RepID=A0A5J4V9H9_9EUKA|nr:MAG: hypothetical protein EZS28_025319 [Streblomastix strix]